VKPTTKLPGIIATRHAMNGSSLEGLRKLLLRSGKAATQVKTFKAYLRWAPFRKGLQLPPRRLITLAFPKAGKIHRNTGSASIVFLFQPKYNSEINHEKKARL
jgi:hypothetical protein